MKLMSLMFLSAVIITILVVLSGLVVMLLWNDVAPFVSGGTIPEIDFWRAVELDLLCGLLFSRNLGAVALKMTEAKSTNKHTW